MLLCFLLQPEHFPFLSVTHSNLDTRCRTSFYTALGRLLVVELGEDEEKFTTFIRPMTCEPLPSPFPSPSPSLMSILTAAAENIRQMFSQQQMGGMVSEEELRRSLVGLCRDLRGIALAFHSRNTYMMLFDWMYPSSPQLSLPHTHTYTHTLSLSIFFDPPSYSYPTYIDLLQRALTLWYHDPTVTTPVLKLMAELVSNRSQVSLMPLFLYCHVSILPYCGSRDCYLM